MRHSQEEREKEQERRVLLEREIKAYKQEEIAENEMLKRDRQYFVEFLKNAFYKNKFYF